MRRFPSLCGYRVIGIVALFAVAAIGFAPAAGARTVKTKYTPGKYAGSSKHAGLCVGTLTCPKVSNTTKRAKHGRILHTHLGSPTGVRARTTASFTSKAFRYRGANGRHAGRLKVSLRRQSDTSAFLSAQDNSATFSVSVVNAKNGAIVAQPWSESVLTPTKSWTRVGPRRIARNALRRGHRYRLMVSSTFTNGVDVMPGADVDYAALKLIAQRHVHHHRHQHHRHHHHG